MKMLKVKLSDRVIVYDCKGTFSSPRLYWMLIAYGHKNVQILDGGFVKWKEENRAIEKDSDCSEES